MKIIKFLWTSILIITVYTVFKENPEFKRILISIGEHVSLFISTIVESLKN